MIYVRPFTLLSPVQTAIARLEKKHLQSVSSRSPSPFVFVSHNGIAVFKAEVDDGLDVLRWVDRMLIRLCTHLLFLVDPHLI